MRRTSREVALSRPLRKPATSREAGPFPFYLDAPTLAQCLAKTRAFWHKVDFGGKHSQRCTTAAEAARRPGSKPGRRQAWNWLQAGPSPALAVPPVDAACSAAGSNFPPDGNGKRAASARPAIHTEAFNANAN